ncbi:hypothetical protein GIB67_018507 [Kingdonia uniflora]|uniref:Vacuolar protein sorting-associated protein 51 homolog n=1 Tax=Kingdonia uniflora TaxID=39325 RepID=A0A7J7LWC0_9MAGN|nr:hypothetical protein GIB67_018507 [Kingdonia uniflora]
MKLLVQKSNLGGLLQKHVEMAAEIKNLDTDLQMLVYENYNKFICATDTIKRMNNNIVGMEANMEQLLEKIMSIQSKSDVVNTSLFEKREQIEKLHRARNLLRKVQFIYDLPSRLAKCIKSEAYGDAVRFFTGAMPIFKVKIREFAETVRAYQEIFHDSEKRLIEIVRNLFTKHFETIRYRIKGRWSSADLLVMLRVAWKDMAMIDEVLPQAALPDFSLEAAHDIIKQYVTNTFSHLLQDVSESLIRVQSKPKDGLEEECYLQVALEGSKKALIQGSMDVLLEIAASFSGGGIRGYEYGPAFVPGEICRIFRSASEKFLHVHKEPREVHMFVDLLLQEKHRRSESNGSTTSSRSNPAHEDMISRSNAQRARSQLLETHLAKLFNRKMEIVTEVEQTQESVVSTIVKLCLKSLQKFVRLQTFNRSGLQQIQLDIQFLRAPVKEIAEDEAAVDFLLDEVT